MKLFRDNIDLISRLLALIELLDNDRWKYKIYSINNETIGRHYRHIADFYLQLITGINSGYIDYDKRARNLSFEENINIAKVTLEEISNNLEAHTIKDKFLRINMNKSMGSGPMDSSLKRELMFVYYHAIHHAHIIQIAVSNEFPNLNFNDEFYSPSTIESLECAK